MSTAISGTIPTTSNEQNTTGPSAFNSLTPSDFVNMMVTQLENQDPLNPTNSQDLLSQMSSIGQLQSSDQLQTTLSGLSFQNQIGAATSLIGKSVQGINASNQNVTGVVSSVTINQVPASQSPSGVATQTVTLNLANGSGLPLGSVTSITPAAATTTGTSTNTSNSPTSSTTASAQQIAGANMAQAIANQATLPANIFSATPV